MDGWKQKRDSISGLGIIYSQRRTDHSCISASCTYQLELAMEILRRQRCILWMRIKQTCIY